MLDLLKTLLAGTTARAEEEVRNRFAVDLLDQKIREAEHDLQAAKNTLAALIQKKRGETAMIEQIRERIADLTGRTASAIEAGAQSLAHDGAAAIATLENELAVRERTAAALAGRDARMRLSIEKVDRRIVDLKQGLIEARAIDAEHRAQRAMNRSIGSAASLREAEALVARIRDRHDPFEQAAILDEIDGDFSHFDAADKLAAAGFGEKTKISAEDVLTRLRRT